jgi:selenophosphate synthetase-related protein
LFVAWSRRRSTQYVEESEATIVGKGLRISAWIVSVPVVGGAADAQVKVHSSPLAMAMAMAGLGGQ